MRERVTCNLVYSSITFPFRSSLLSPYFFFPSLPGPLIPSNHLYDLFKKRVKEGGGRVGARVSQKQLNTDRRAAQNKQNKRLDHEHQISIVLTLFLMTCLKTPDGDMLMWLFPFLVSCTNNYLDGDL